MILALDTPHIDWLALSAPLALLGAGGVNLHARIRGSDRRFRDPLLAQR